jgi:hypothetical protein
MNTDELIGNIANSDNVKANSSFDAVMGEKLKTALDARKIEIATQLGSTSTDVEEIEVELKGEE